ncbi:MAG: hypothetical protein R3Y15_07800 [Rikenellaceae bacterium]
MKKTLTLLKAAARRVSHPVFYVALLFSSLMWFVTKMSIEYREMVIIPVSIESQNFEVVCNVQSTGYRLLLNNMFPRSNKIELSLADLGVVTTDDSPTYVSVTPYALYNAISGRMDHLRVLNVSTSLYVKRNNE